MAYIETADIISDLKTVLNSKYSIAFQLFIRDFISRENYGSGILQYRIWDNSLNNYVTTLNDFINNINSAIVKYAYSYTSSIKDNTPHPFIITIQNYDITLSKFSLDDNYYFEKFGGQEKKKISFICNVPIDPVLPFEIYEIVLSNA